MRVYLVLSLLCILLFQNPLIAQASAFKVWPLQIYLTAENAIETLTFENLGNHDIMIETSIVRWEQDLYEDHFVPTNDVIITPPIFTVKPKEKQLLRIGYLGGLLSDKLETNYRLLLKEVSLSNIHSAAIKMMLNISIPIFHLKESIINQATTQPPQIKYESGQFVVYNPNHHHIKLNKLFLSNSTDEAIFSSHYPYYILAQKTKIIPLPSVNAESQPATLDYSFMIPLHSEAIQQTLSLNAD